MTYRESPFTKNFVRKNFHCDSKGSRNLIRYLLFPRKKNLSLNCYMHTMSVRGRFQNPTWVFLTFNAGLSSVKPQMLTKKSPSQLIALAYRKLNKWEKSSYPVRLYTISEGYMLSAGKWNRGSIASFPEQISDLYIYPKCFSYRCRSKLWSRSMEWASWCLSIQTYCLFLLDFCHLHMSNRMVSSQSSPSCQ